MKMDYTSAELAALLQALGSVFETAELHDPAACEQSVDGLCIGYEHALDDVRAVISRRIRVDGTDKMLRLTGLLASREPGVTARELSLYRDDMVRDFLTGTYNRAYWDTRLAVRLNDCAAAGKPAAMALVRVDGFDSLLQQYGSEDTDQLVCYVANLWKRFYDEGNEKAVCRMGECTFAVVCCGADELDLQVQMRYLYEKMHRVCTSTHGMLRNIPFTLSIACAGLNEVEEKSALGLYHACSRRLSKVSAEGGDQVARL